MPLEPKSRAMTQPTLCIVVLHMESSARTDLLASGAAIVVQAVARLDKDGVGTTVQSSAPDVVAPTGKRAAQSLLRRSPAKPERQDGED